MPSSASPALLVPAEHCPAGAAMAPEPCSTRWNEQMKPIILPERRDLHEAASRSRRTRKIGSKVQMLSGVTRIGGCRRHRSNSGWIRWRNGSPSLTGQAHEGSRSQEPRRRGGPDRCFRLGVYRRRRALRLDVRLVRETLTKVDAAIQVAARFLVTRGSGNACEPERNPTKAASPLLLLRGSAVQGLVAERALSF